MAVGVNALSKMLPDKLCKKAGIKRKTAHCLSITCATRLYHDGVNEKQARERTGHRSDSLFHYQKPSKKQVKIFSDALAPPDNLFSGSEIKQEDTCVVSNIWSSTVGDDTSDEVLTCLDIPNCSSRPKTNVVNKDSLHSKGSTDVFPARLSK